MYPAILLDASTPVAAAGTAIAIIVVGSRHSGEGGEARLTVCFLY